MFCNEIFLLNLSLECISGGGQLFLFVLMFAISYGLCCLPCCEGCLRAKDSMKGKVFRAVCSYQDTKDSPPHEQIKVQYEI